MTHALHADAAAARCRVVADARACPAIELPLNAQAVAGDSLPITVTLNTDLVTVNTPVTGLGLLKSYLMLCPGQDVPQQLSGGGNTIGSLTDASGVTDVYVGETYARAHVRVGARPFELTRAIRFRRHSACSTSFPRSPPTSPSPRTSCTATTARC